MSAPIVNKPVSIVIPVYNQVAFTRTCLLTLSRHTPGALYEVIVVDNASTDETQALLASVSGALQVIRNERNLGFARACNQGARAARGEHLLFLNNDTAPLPGWLEAMLAELAPDVGVVGSKLLYPQTELVQHAGMAMVVEDTLPVHLFRHMAPALGALDVARDLEMVTGACMLIRRDLFERLGGFDEGYLNGFEDVDLCLRVREAGYRVRYTPQSVLYHCEGTSEGRFDYNQANYERFRARWHERFDAAGRLRVRTPNRRDAALAVHAPIFAPNACGEESRALVTHLAARADLAVCVTPPHSAIFQQQLAPTEAARLEALTVDEVARSHVRLLIAPLEAIERQPNGYHIARTSFPLASPPADWVSRCNAMDELWLPTRAHVEACRVAGVTARLLEVPVAVDLARFRRDLTPLSLPVSAHKIFLTVGEWGPGRGWENLIAAWSEAFAPDDKACLLLRVHPVGRADNPYLGPEVDACIEACLHSLGRSRNEVAPIVVLPEQLAAEAMPHLYVAAHAFVPLPFGATWGRAALEAEACGLPIVASATNDLASALAAQYAQMNHRTGVAPVSAVSDEPLWRLHSLVDATLRRLAVTT